MCACTAQRGIINEQGLWTSYIKRSIDGGKTWGQAEKMKAKFKGPAKNPPILLPNGLMVSGASSWGATAVHVETSKDDGITWKSWPDISFDFDLTQPSIFPIGNGRYRMVCQPCISWHSHDLRMKFIET